MLMLMQVASESICFKSKTYISSIGNIFVTEAQKGSLLNLFRQF